jgi:acyl dehydratase
MTPPRGPIVRYGTPACPYSELLLGDEIRDAVTITETHVVLAAAIFKDHGPNHVNALQAAANRFGARIAHGPLLLGVMDGALGNVLGTTVVALLEQSAVFKAPTFLGDTVVCNWRVAERVDKAQFGGGGIVTFEGHAANQAGHVLAEMRVVLAVSEEPLWEAGTTEEER